MFNQIVPVGVASRIRKRAVLAGVALAAIAVADASTSVASAQTVGAPSEASDSESRLEEIVVTARKSDERLQDVPASISVVTSDQLAQRAVVTPEDLRLIVPGLAATSTGRSANSIAFTIRGQNAPDSLLSTDSSVGIYLDNVNQPRLYGTRTGMFDIESVQVAKGPQGTLFGRNTTGGAVLIQTVQPDLDDANGYATLSGGEHNTFGAKAAINLPLVTDIAAIRVAATTSFTDGDAFGANNFPFRKSNDLGLRAQLLVKPAENFSIRIGGSYTHVNGPGHIFQLREIVPGIQGADIQYGLFLGNPLATAGAAGQAAYTAALSNQKRYRSNGLPLDRDFYRGWGSNVQMVWSASDAFQLKSTTAYSGFKRDTPNDFDGVAFQVARALTATDQKFFSQELEASGRLGAFKYVTGLFFSRETGTETAVSDILPSLVATKSTTISDIDVKNRSLGAYAQADFSPFERLTLTGGLRFSRDQRDITPRNRLVSQTDFSVLIACQVPAAARPASGACEAKAPTLTFENVNYTLAAKFEVTDDLNFYATTRSGFRAGGYNILTDLTQGFLPFEPEKVTDYEVGIKAQLLDRRLQVDGALFRSDYRGIQRSVVVFLPSGGFTRATSNAASATLQGAELTVTALPVKGFRIDANLSYLDAHYDEYIVRNAAGAIVSDFTKLPFLAPAWTGSVNAGYEFDLRDAGRLRVSANYYRQSRAYLAEGAVRGDRALSQRAYGLLGARVEWNYDPEGLQLALIGRNLTDTYYYSFGQDIRSIGIAVAVPGQSRYLGAEITKKF